MLHKTTLCRRPIHTKSEFSAWKCQHDYVYEFPCRNSFFKILFGGQIDFLFVWMPNRETCKTIWICCTFILFSHIRPGTNRL